MARGEARHETTGKGLREAFVKPARHVSLPSPEVHFGADLFPRLGALRARLANARERREGAGRNRFQGVGSEVVGYRPYRPGEDPRLLDWNLLARFERPFVRVTAREASEHWALVLDASASMGVGPPGKLQRAAEVALAVGALAVAGAGARADATLFLADGTEGPRLRRVADLRAWAGFLEGTRAAGTAGLASFAASRAHRLRCGRLFLLGDFLDLAHEELDAFVRRGRELFCLRLLAPQEIHPVAGAVRFADAETGERRAVEVTPAARGTYERRLTRANERWSAVAERRRARFLTRSSAVPFEAVVQDLLG